MLIPKGSVDQTLYFKLTTTVGAPATALTVTDLDLTYVRDRVAAVKADLTALAAVDSVHADNKAIEVDATNAPGLYRADVPDAAFLTGVDHVQVIVNGAAIDPSVIECELIESDDVAGDVLDIKAVIEHETYGNAAVQTQVGTVSTNVTTVMGKTELLPAVAAGLNGGLPTTNGTKLNQTVDLTTGQSIACNDKTGFALTAAYDLAKTALQPGGTLATVTTLTNMPVSNLLLSTSVASISVDEVEITLVAGSTVDDAYNGQTVVLYDVNNSNYPSIRKIIDYVGATKTITIDTGADFTVVAGDTVRIFIDGNGTNIGLISTIVGANGGKIDEVAASIAEVDAAIQSLSVSLSDEELAELISGLVEGILSAPEISRLLAGTGSVTWPYYVLGPGSVPIPNARVFVYSNSGLTTLVAKGTTNDFGLITFYLDPGTYYFVVRATGYTFALDTEVVS